MPSVVAIDNRNVVIGYLKASSIIMLYAMIIPKAWQSSFGLRWLIETFFQDDSWKRDEERDVLMPHWFTGRQMPPSFPSRRTKNRIIVVIRPWTGLCRIQ